MHNLFIGRAMVHRSEIVDSNCTVPLPTNVESVDNLSPAAAEEDAPVFNIGLSSVEDDPDDERGGGDYDPDVERGGGGDYDPDDERGGDDDGPDDERGGDDDGPPDDERGGDDGLDERGGDDHPDDDERGGGSIIIIKGSSSDRDNDQQNTSGTSNCVAVGLRGGSSSDTSSAEEDDVLALTTRIETSLSNTHMKTISGGKRRRKRKGVRTPLEEDPECRGMCGSGPKCLAKHPDAGFEDQQRDQQSLRRCANFGGVVQCPLWIGIACAEKFECNTCRICAVLKKMPPSSSSEVEVGRYSIIL